IKHSGFHSAATRALTDILGDTHDPAKWIFCAHPNPHGADVSHEVFSHMDHAHTVSLAFLLPRDGTLFSMTCKRPRRRQRSILGSTFCGSEHQHAVGVYHFVHGSHRRSMTAIFKTAVPYAGDVLSLPVHNLEEALPFYETVMGFRIVSRGEAAGKSAVLGRD